MAQLGSLTLPDEDLCHIQWRGAAFTQSQGPLTPATALAYFSLSPFFDRRSTNQALRMQTMYSGKPPLTWEEEDKELERFVGTEFKLVKWEEANGGLYMIEKRLRKSPVQVQTLATYYIIRDDIYQAPSLHSVLSDRLLTSFHALDGLFDVSQKHKPAFDPRQGYNWRVQEPTSGTSKSADGAKVSATMDVDGADTSSAGGGDDADGDDEPDEVSFNPLLMRALQATIADRVATPSGAAPAASLVVPGEPAVAVSSAVGSPAGGSTPAAAAGAVDSKPTSSKLPGTRLR